jgi:phosphotransferase system  glucose/maltose/N-acetylglucosamine-specific IIC component
MAAMSTRVIRVSCGTVFVGGIAGMIVSSVNGNNEGWVLLFGMATALAAIVLISVSSVSAGQRIDVFEEADAERLESRVQALVDAGADERAVREIVRDAVRLGRRSE